MIIAIDFDDTVCKTEPFPVIIGLIPDAKTYIKKLKDDGHYIIIFSCRTGEDAIDAVNFLLENEIPFNRFNDNHPGNVRKYGTNSRKIYAHTYVDDKQVGNLPPWSEIYRFIQEKEARYLLNNSI